MRLYHFRCTETSRGTLGGAGGTLGKRAFTGGCTEHCDTVGPLSSSVQSACPDARAHAPFVRYRFDTTVCCTVVNRGIARPQCTRIRCSMELHRVASRRRTILSKRLCLRNQPLETQRWRFGPGPVETSPRGLLRLFNVFATSRVAHT
eukprot:987312-Prymnesium_polylepis.3